MVNVVYYVVVKKNPINAIEKYRRFLNSEGEALIRLLDVALTKITNETLVEFNIQSQIQLTPSQARVMQMLCLKGMKGIELADRLGISKQAAGKITNELESIGLVFREIDPSDSRAKVIKHTTEGLAVVSILIEITLKLEKKYSKILGIVQYREMKHTISRILDWKYV